MHANPTAILDYFGPLLVLSMNALYADTAFQLAGWTDPSAIANLFGDPPVYEALCRTLRWAYGLRNRDRALETFLCTSHRLVGHLRARIEQTRHRRSIAACTKRTRPAHEARR